MRRASSPSFSSNACTVPDRGTVGSAEPRRPRRRSAPGAVARRAGCSVVTSAAGRRHVIRRWGRRRAVSCAASAGRPAVAPSMAGEAHGRLGNRLEHRQRDAAAARSAVAVATSTHPVEGDLDVVERPPSTGRDQRIHSAQGTRRLRHPVVGRLCIVRCLECLAALVESGELFATEAELSLAVRRAAREAWRPTHLPCIPTGSGRECGRGWNGGDPYTTPVAMGKDHVVLARARRCRRAQIRHYVGRPAPTERSDSGREPPTRLPTTGSGAGGE